MQTKKTETVHRLVYKFIGECVLFEVDPTNPELRKVTKFTIKKKTSYLRDHFGKLENIFQEVSASLWQEKELEDKRTENHEDDSQYDYRPSDALKEIELIYLRMHRYAAILAIYSYLESSLNKLCNELKIKKNIQLSVSELNGDGIFRCRKYLHHLVGIDFIKINDQWSKLSELNKIRNCIIHADGNAENVRGSGDFIKMIQKSKNLGFAEGRLIMTSRNFVYQSIDNAEIVLTYIAQYDTSNSDLKI